MATPLSSSAMLTALRSEGADPKTTSNWTTHNRNHVNKFDNVNGIMIHHTAGVNSLNLCINGTASLPGPLCHAHLAKDGTLTLISNGRANHAGSIAQNAHNAVVQESSTHPRPDAAEPVDGNRHYYGIEIENRGNGTDPYPQVQYQKAVLWAAAICRAHGWSEHSIIGHKEGTRRKIDPSFDMNKFRADVRKQLTSTNTPESGGDDMPSTLYYNRKSGLTLPRGQWKTLDWDRVHTPQDGWKDRSLAQTLLKGSHAFTLSLGLRAEGLETGNELQIRVARNHRPGGVWSRAKSWAINSPVHAAGKAHFTHTWSAHHPGGNDSRLVVEVLSVNANPETVFIDNLEASILYW